MGKFLILSFFATTALIAYVVFIIISDGVPRKLEDNYWGPSSTQSAKEDTSIRPFKISIPDKILENLNQRLKLELDENRFANPLEGTGFEYGFNHNYIKKVGQHWLSKYEWRAREKLLNKYPQFKTKISGLDIHFQHVKSAQNGKYKKTKPLLLLHGWPGSFVEFQKIIPMLTEPKDSDMNFELIIPSLPGYGFSDPAAKPGLGPAEIGQIFVKLMKRLGHDKFYIQGGDWGSIIGSAISIFYPDNVIGLHSNLCSSFHPLSTIKLFAVSMFPNWFLEKDEAARFSQEKNIYSLLLQETGYLHLQASKPDTIGVGLANSPLGLASYILEKFSGWTNQEWMNKQDGGLSNLNTDELLDNVMIYWVTNSITTSMRIYSEFFSSKELYMKEMPKLPVHVPTGCLLLRNEFYNIPSIALRDQYKNLLQISMGSNGGHFAAFEVPEIVAQDAVKLFKKIEFHT